jgi:hypothetical protein
MAQKMDATVVEPCIQNGRLVPWRKRERNRLLGEWFDISSFRPWFGSQDKFERRAAVSHKAKMCMNNKAEKCGGVPHFFQATRSSVLDKAVLMGRTSAIMIDHGAS